MSPNMYFRLVISTNQAAHAACSISRIASGFEKNANKVQTSFSTQNEAPDVSVSQGK
jgi:hypothetical protein